MTEVISEELRHAREYAVQVAHAIEVAREPLEALFREFLIQETPLTALDVVTYCAGISCLPGPPEVLSPSISDRLRMCRRIAIAANRGRIARDRGIPPVPVIALQKTGSSFVTSILSDGLDIASGVVSPDYFFAVPAWMNFAASFPISLHEHLAPTAENLAVLRRAGVSRLVVHIRDPRQMVLSMAHHVLRHPDTTDPFAAAYNAAYNNGGLRRLLDVLIPDHIAHYRDWLNGWRSRSQHCGIALHVTTFESLVADRENFFKELLDFFGVNDAARRGIARSLTKKHWVEGENNIRNGTADEWRRVLTPQQIRTIESLSDGAFSELYGF